MNERGGCWCGCGWGGKDERESAVFLISGSVAFCDHQR